MGSTTSQATATQKDVAEGGAAVPVAAASAPKTTALVPTWTVMATDGGTWEGERRSRIVAATRQSMPRNGTRYAHPGTPSAAPASADVTTATPVTPRASPAHCVRVTRVPRRGPASAPVTRGCVLSMRAVVPVETPSWMA